MDPGRSTAAGVMLAPAMPASGDRVGREGRLALRVERRDGANVVAHCRYTLPLQVLAPLALDDAAAVVSVLNPTGGLVGGDRLTIDVGVSAGAHACVTTPSATRVYRTAGPPAEQHVRLALEPNAALEWIPDHTIPSAGSALRQRIEVSVGEQARLILVDAFAAGRVARGEAWRFRSLESGIVVSDPRGWLVRDRFMLQGNDRWASLGFAEGRAYFATIIVIGDEVDRLEQQVADALARHPDVESGVALLPRRGAIVRLLAATAPALVAAVDTVWAEARRALLGLPPLSLRKL
jgi:urease accessory protein